MLGKGVCPNMGEKHLDSKKVPREGECCRQAGAELCIEAGARSLREGAWGANGVGGV